MDDIPQVSYAMASNAALSGLISTTNQQLARDLEPQYQLYNLGQNLWTYPSTTTTGTTITYPTPQRTIMAKLIRYTVVNPNPLVLEHAPETAILLEGRGLMNGGDEKGFLLEIAPKIGQALLSHNIALKDLTYRDEDGKTQTFPPIKISQLDVVVETVKSYER